jgi:tRNA(fMet)-specific endonuclease VapC
LKKKGRPIPTNDIWIASLAFQHGQPLFSKDKHFEAVPGLVMVSY